MGVVFDEQLAKVVEKLNTALAARGKLVIGPTPPTLPTGAKALWLDTSDPEFIVLNLVTGD